MAKKSKLVKFALGKFIRELRLAKGLTLESLCTGDSFSETDGAICDAGELGKYERGERQPRWDKFEKIMQRHGEDPHKYYQGYALTEQDREWTEKKNRLKFLAREENPENIEKSEALIHELEQDECFSKSKLNRQFLLYTKALLSYHCEEYKTMYDTAYEGIKITKPLFDEDKIDTYVLFFDEIQLVNLIAISHFHISSIERSTNVFLKLKKCLDSGYVDEEEKSKTYIRILFNLSNNLGQLGRYDECISICEIGIEFCGKYQHSHHYPLFLFNKGVCLICLDRKEEGISILKDVSTLFNAFKRFAELSHMEKFVEKEFGIKL